MPDRRTRLTVPIVVVTGVAAVGLGIGWQDTRSDSPIAQPPPPSLADAAPSLGLVGVHYRLERSSGHAGNQIAVWIEDAGGRHVRSLFATSFTAEGGFARRPMSLPEWRAAANWDRASEEEVREVSRPAQAPGDQVVYWDGLDSTGIPVPPGSYRFRIEGNLLWENRVVYTGTLTIGEQGASAEASAEYLPPAAAEIGGLVSGVRAEFLPGRRLDPTMVTTYTRGS